MIDINEIKSWFTKPVETMTKQELSDVKKKILHYSDPNGLKSKKANEYTDEDRVMRCIWCVVSWSRKTPDWNHFAKVIEKIHTMHKYIVLYNGEPYHYVDGGVESLLVIYDKQDWMNFLNMINEEDHHKYSLAECEITYHPLIGGLE